MISDISKKGIRTYVHSPSLSAFEATPGAPHVHSTLIPGRMDPVNPGRRDILRRRQYDGHQSSCVPFNAQKPDGPEMHWIL